MDKKQELEEQLKKSAEIMKEYKDNGFYEQEAQEHENYNKIMQQLDELNEKEPTEKEKLEEELKKSAERMKEYKDNGFYEQEVQEHEYYNEILEKLNNIKKIEKLEEDLKKSAERMKEYKDNGFYEQEAQEHEEYNKIVEELDKLKKELEKDKSEKEEIEEENEPEEKIVGEGYIGEGFPSLEEQFEKITGKKMNETDEYEVVYDGAMDQDGISDEVYTEFKIVKKREEPSIEEENIKDNQPKQEEAKPKRNPWSAPSIAGYEEMKKAMENETRRNNTYGRDGATDGNGTADNVYDEIEKDNIPNPEPEPEPEPEPQPEPELEPQPQPEKALVRSFWEIVDSTDTEHSGTFAIGLKKLGDIHPIKNITPLNAITVPVQGVMKLIGKIGDKITGASKKQDIMQENIDGLSEEEFEVIVSNMTEAKMRQNKFNDLYLTAISKRLAKRQNDKIAPNIEKCKDDKEVLKQIDEKKQELEEMLNNIKTPEDKKTQIKQAISYLQAQEAHYTLDNTISRMQQEKDMKVITDFDRGRINKSRSRMNIKGWIAGVFNPDNREVNKQMAELSKKQREAREMGDIVTSAKLDREMEEVEKENTKEIKFFGSDRCVISRGARIHEEVVVRPNDANQTKGAQLAMNIAAIANLVAIGKSVEQAKQIQMEQTRLNEHLKSHNAEINKVNGQVSELKDATTPNQNWVDAANKQIGEDQATYTGIGHNTQFINDNNGVGFNVNGSDTALHATDEAMKTSTDAVRGALTGDATKDFSTLVQHHTQVTGSAVKDMAQAGLDTAKHWSATTQYSENGFTQGLEQILNSNPDTLQILSQISETGAKLGNLTAPTVNGFMLNIPTNMVPEVVALISTGTALTKTAINNDKQKIDVKQKHKENKKEEKQDQNQEQEDKENEDNKER